MHTLAQIPVDSGTVLIVDPAHVPADVLRRLTTANDHGVTIGAVLSTPWGDGLLSVDAVDNFVVLDTGLDEDVAWSATPGPLLNALIGTST